MLREKEVKGSNAGKGEKKSLAPPFYFLFFRLLSPHTPFIVILSNFWGI